MRLFAALETHAVSRRDRIAPGNRACRPATAWTARTPKCWSCAAPMGGGRPLQRPGCHGRGHRTGGEDAPQGAKPVRLRSTAHRRSRMAFVSASWPSSEGSRLRARASR